MRVMSYAKGGVGGWRKMTSLPVWSLNTAVNEKRD